MQPTGRQHKAGVHQRHCISCPTEMGWVATFKVRLGADDVIYRRTNTLAMNLSCVGGAELLAYVASAPLISSYCRMLASSSVSTSSSRMIEWWKSKFNAAMCWRFSIKLLLVLPLPVLCFIFIFQHFHSIGIEECVCACMCVQFLPTTHSLNASGPLQ